MSSLVSRRTLVVAAVAAVAGVGTVAGVGLLGAGADQPDPGEQLLTQSRRAAEEHDFTGVLELTWSDAAGNHSSDVAVKSTNGVLALGDQRQVIVEGPRRFVHDSGGWLTVWSQDISPDSPSPSEKWDLRVHDGPPVAGRPTQQVDATDRHRGKVRERLFFDVATGLLLRREQLDTHGRTVRMVGFTSIGEPAPPFVAVQPGTAARPPQRSTKRQPRVVGKVAAPYRAPKDTGDRFQLIGRYNESGDTLHLFYSDGLFEVSVFEQQGRLDWSGLPSGGRTGTVAGHDAREYRTPGGVVMVWESDDVVYTSVSDAPTDQVDGVLADFGPSPSPSVVDRVADFVTGPFSW